MSRNLSENDDQVRHFGSQITRAGLGPIALFLLEPGRPLALLAAQLIWLAQPVLSLAWQPQKVAQWARFLEQPGSIEALIEHIEAEE